MRNVLLISLAVIGFLFVGGCSHSKEARQPKETAPAIVWPPPPEIPRVAYVQSISRPDDVGIKRSGLRRLAQWLTGSEGGKELLVKPFGIALDENDNLCLTDTGANTVCYFERAKMKWRYWDRIEKVRFLSPVAVAKSGAVFYVADSARGSVVAFTEAGKLVFEVTNRLERPSGLIVQGQRLWVVDSRRHCVVGFSLSGQYLSEFGRRGREAGEFNFPTHITADQAGNIYVTDTLNHRIQVFDNTGKYKSRFGEIGDSTGQFSRPKGVAVDPAGHIYVIDALFDNLQIFSDTGRLLLNVGEAGSNAGQFWLPNGIVISRQNEIFVADSYNRRVQVLKYLGTP